MLHPDVGVGKSSRAESPRQDEVLIAEDDPMFRQVLESFLQKWDYRVTAVENGLDAWSVLQHKDAPQDGNPGLDDAGAGRY